MKLTKKDLFLRIFAVVATLMLSLLFFTACDEVNKYSITVLSSDINRGNVNPNSRTLNENSLVEISATETSGHFVCWIKDQNRVVSAAPIYQFEINEQTVGTYIGVFDQSSADKMMYATLTGVVVANDSTAGGSSPVDVAITLRPSSTFERSRQIFAATQVSRNVTASANPVNVFSFLSEDQYVFIVTLSQEGREPQVITLNLYEQSFTENNGYQASIKSQGGADSTEVTLIFSKLTKSLYENLVI